MSGAITYSWGYLPVDWQHGVACFMPMWVMLHRLASFLVPWSPIQEIFFVHCSPPGLFFIATIHCLSCRVPSTFHLLSYPVPTYLGSHLRSYSAASFVAFPHPRVRTLSYLDLLGPSLRLVRKDCCRDTNRYKRQQDCCRDTDAPSPPPATMKYNIFCSIVVGLMGSRAGDELKWCCLPSHDH